MKTTSNLTERECKYLEHVQRAYARQQSLAQYCRDTEIDVKELYSAKQQLRRKGALPERSMDAGCSDGGSQFIPVRLAAPASSSSIAVCRLRHPSGWVLECINWPDASWLNEVFGVAGHAAT